MIELAAQIAGNFSSDSPIGKYLDEAVNHSKKLSGLKDKYQNGFKQRLHISASELKSYDKSLLQELLHTARNMPNKEFSVIQIVAFNTTEFFADDPTGKTLMGRNLQEVW